MSDESIFSLEQDYSSRTSLNPDFVKEKYDYDVRMFKFDKSLAIQAPTWRMRDTQTIESYMDEFLRNPALATRDLVLIQLMQSLLLLNTQSLLKNLLKNSKILNIQL